MTSRSLDIDGLSNHAAVWDNRCHAVNHPSRVRRSMTNTDCSEPQEGRDSLRAEERHRLALELHDTVGQALALAKLQLVRMQQKLREKRVIRRSTWLRRASFKDTNWDVDTSSFQLECGPATSKICSMPRSSRRSVVRDWRPAIADHPEQRSAISR